MAQPTFDRAPDVFAGSSSRTYERCIGLFVCEGAIKSPLLASSIVRAGICVVALCIPTGRSSAKDPIIPACSDVPNRRGFDEGGTTSEARWTVLQVPETRLLGRGYPITATVGEGSLSM